MAGCTPLNVLSPVHEYTFALMTRGRPARDRLESLAAGATLDEEPLFAPIIYAAAANAESWGIDEFLGGPGRLARGAHDAPGCARLRCRIQLLL